MVLAIRHGVFSIDDYRKGVLDGKKDMGKYNVER
jgi:hypothetical protein